jgi:hypothetical protein
MRTRIEKRVPSTPASPNRGVHKGFVLRLLAGIGSETEWIPKLIAEMKVAKDDRGDAAAKMALKGRGSDHRHRSAGCWIDGHPGIDRGSHNPLVATRIVTHTDQQGVGADNTQKDEVAA